MEVEDPPDDEVIRNVATGKYHLDAGGGRLVDGKLFPINFVRLSGVPPGGRQCSKCF